MEMKRRQFLKTSFAGLGSAAFAVETSRAADSQPSISKPFSTDPVALVDLTPTIKTSRIGLGTGVHGGNRQCNLTRMDRAKALDIFRYSYDNGIRFFDLADMYGTHGLAEEALRGKPRDSFVLSTKIWPHAGGVPEKERPSASVCVKRFLQELKTDYIDNVQLHCMMKPDWAPELERYFEDLENLKKEGLIRGHGVSCHALGAVQNAATNPWVDVIHTRMNTANTRMDGTLDENVAAARLAKENGKGVICMKVLGEGSIKEASERKRSTDFVTRCDAVDVMIVGFEERSHIDEFLANVAETLKNMEAERKTAANA